MTGIMVVGHGHFATGVRSAVELILGGQTDFAAVDFPEGDTKTELEANIRQALDSLASMEKILIFCDLLSGSPFNTVIMEAMKDERLTVYYGVNLGMLIETLMNRNLGSTWEELTSRVLESGQEQLGVFTPDTSGEDDDDAWD